MAEKAKAKGKKIGRWSRKPTNSSYKSQNRRDVNKARRIERAYKQTIASRERKATEDGMILTNAATFAPGWDISATGSARRSR